MANRIKTWSNGEVLTHTDLNAEFDNIYTGTVNRTAGYWGSNDDIPLSLGNSQDAYVEYNTDQTNPTLVVGLPATGESVIFCQKGDMGTDFGHAAYTDPTVVVHSADATTTTDYIALSHDQTDAVINVGGGNLNFKFGGTEKADIDSDGDLTIAGDLGASGTGPHAIGGAVSSVARLRLLGAFTSSGASTTAYGLLNDGTITGANGDTARQVGTYLDNSITTQSNSETVTDIAQLMVEEPDITKGTDTVTNASTLKIVAAPTEGSNNYALFVDAGVSRFDAGVVIGGATKNADAILDLQSTTGAFLLPRMTEVQRDALTPVDGMLVHNTTTGYNNMYISGAGAGWYQM